MSLFIWQLKYQWDYYLKEYWSLNWFYEVCFFWSCFFISINLPYLASKWHECPKHWSPPSSPPPKKKKKKLKKSRKKSWNQHWLLIHRQRFLCIVSILETQKLCWLTYAICLKTKEDLTTEVILHRSNTKIWDNILEKYAVRAFANLQVVCSIPSPAVGS